MNSIATAGTMDQETKFLFVLMQIDNLTQLLKDNEYQTFLYSHLIPIKVEVQRQLTNLTHSSKMKE